MGCLLASLPINIAGMKMRKLFAVISGLLLTGLMFSGNAAVAQAPGVINFFDAVCSADYPTRCLAINSDGSINVSGSITASNPSVGTNGAAAPTSSTQIGAKNGSNLIPLKSTDGSSLDVNCITGCSGGGGGGTSSNFGSAFPTAGTAAGMSDGTNMVPFANAQNGGGDAVNGAKLLATGLWGFNGTTWDRLQLDGSKFLKVILQTGSNVIGAVTQSGTWTVSQGGAPWSVTGSGSAGSAASGVVTVQGIASMTPLLANPGTAANWGVGATASAVPANANYVGGNKSGNLTGFVMGSSNDLTVGGAGTAGSASGGVLTVQGVASMTPVQVSQATASNLNATVVGTGSAGSPASGVVTIQGIPSASPVATNMTFVGSNAVSTGSGTNGTGVQRVTLATDQGALAAWGLGATGAAVPAGAQYQAANTGGNLTGLINCTSVAKYDASTSGSTQLVALASSQVVRICGYSILAAGSVNVKLVYGTGSNCVTSPSDITPAFQLVAQAGLVDRAPYWQGLATAASNALCINTSAGVAVQAIVYYTQF